MTKTDLFLELAKPDSEGKSRWVQVSEFTGKYAALKLGNGGSWCRKESILAKKYHIEFDKTQTPGNSIDAVRTNGYNNNTSFNQAIRSDIKEYYKNKPCVMLGIVGNSENTKIEIDHKDGQKNDNRVSNLQTQQLKDFQPLCKAANDAKRQIPFTSDSSMVNTTIQIVRLEEYSYATGTSLNISKNLLKDILKTGYEKNKRKSAVFFISDGEITIENEKLDSFSDLKQYIQDGAVLGYGTTTGGKMKNEEWNTVDYIKYYPDGSYKQEYALSYIDENNLKKLANDLGIDYIKMDSTNNIKDKVNKLKKSSSSQEKKEKKTETYKDIYYYFAIPLVILLLIDFTIQKKKFMC